METAQKEEMAKRLDPAHLKALDVNQEKEAVEKALAEPAVTEPEVSLNDPRLNKEYPFNFEWTDGRGKIWKGGFINKILSIRERQMVGVLRSRMATGVPLESLDELTSDINLMIAHMSYSLKKRPAWAEDLQELTDVRLLQEIYQEVLDHESMFLGYSKPQAKSEGER